jgi:hypothetical protein
MQLLRFVYVPSEVSSGEQRGKADLELTYVRWVNFFGYFLYPFSLYPIFCNAALWSSADDASWFFYVVGAAALAVEMLVITMIELIFGVDEMNDLVQSHGVLLSLSSLCFLVTLLARNISTTINGCDLNPSPTASINAWTWEYIREHLHDANGTAICGNTDWSTCHIVRFEIASMVLFGLAFVAYAVAFCFWFIPRFMRRNDSTNYTTPSSRVTVINVSLAVTALFFFLSLTFTPVALMVNAVSLGGMHDSMWINLVFSFWFLMLVIPLLLTYIPWAWYNVIVKERFVVALDGE